MEGLTINELSARILAGELTSETLTDYYLERIDAYDKFGPAVNAVIALNPKAREHAKQLDRDLHLSGAKGPLHGVPILLKDNVATDGELSTTAGSLAMGGVITAKRSHVARRLAEAGALILGKTNLSEWANFRSSHSTSGWSGLGGQTLNPFSLDRSPGGSSSGSGVAVACDFCAAAVGTETDGSIVSPSAANGVVGIKPTVGLVSRAGIVPISASQDTAGPMARSVADAALLLGALAGEDPDDDATLAAGPRRLTDYSQFVDPDGLRGARIGVARDYCGINDRVDDLFENALAAMADAGAEIVEEVALPARHLIGEPERMVLQYEFKDGLNRYLAAYAPVAEVASLNDVIAFNNVFEGHEMPYFGQDIFHQSQSRGPLTEAGYLKAREACQQLSRAKGIDKAMDEHRLDALVAPTRNLPGAIDWAIGDRNSQSSAIVAAVAGYPSISVPMGVAFGLPAGLLIFGRAYSEGKLIQIAAGFEHVVQGRRVPTFRPNIFTRGKARQPVP